MIAARAWFVVSAIWWLGCLFSMPASASPFRYAELAVGPPLAVLIIGLMIRWVVTGRVFR